MTSSTTSTNNNDFQDDDHILRVFSYFCDYLFSGLGSYSSVSFNVNQTATHATARDCWTLIIQNMFGDICNENSRSVKIKAIYSALKNAICIKINLLMIHIRVDFRGKRRRIYFCRPKISCGQIFSSKVGI